MRKHPFVKDMRKLNFHLVPVSGVAKRNGSDKKFRAEFVRGYEEGDNRGVLGEDQMRRSVEFAVVKLNEDLDTDEKAEDKYRYLRASILPE